MTVQEIKDEYKQSEGDPIVKGRHPSDPHGAGAQAHDDRRSAGHRGDPQPDPLRAVELEYENGMQALLCVAKAADQFAFKIREIAKASNVPIVENPPLARTLFAQMEIDQKIPEEHFRAVAEVIGYVLRMRKKNPGGPSDLSRFR